MTTSPSRDGRGDLAVNDAALPAVEEAAPAFPSLAAFRAAHGELLRRYHQDPAGPEVVTAIEGFITQGRATGAVLDDDDRWAGQSLLDYWTSCLYRLGREPPDATLAPFDPAQAPELPDDACPYLGLEAFREEHHHLFYGRQRLLDQLVGRLAEGRLLAVVGPSGSGKSSLVRAGLLPALKSGRVPGSETWRILSPLTPGSDPLAALAAAAEALRPAEVEPAAWRQAQAAAFRQNPRHLLALAATAGGVPVVLAADQFEEVFTLCASGVDRAAFLDTLLAFVSEPGPRHTVVLTMRSDFATRVAEHAAFQARFEPAQVYVTALSADELREAIEKPAADAGLKFEAGVVEALVKDILGEPAGLPLLQFALRRLWEARERNRVTRTAYERLGGARGALARSADDFYGGLLHEEKVTARRLLLRLTRPVVARDAAALAQAPDAATSLEVTSNRVRRRDLLRLEAEDRVQRVLTKLVEARLVRVTASDDAENAQVEVAHEALVRNWPRLVGWLEEERVALTLRRRLEERAEEWERRGRAGGLLDRLELLEAERWLASPAAADLGYAPVLPEFVAASREAIAREDEARESARQRELAQTQALLLTNARANRYLKAVLGLAAVALALATILAVWLWQENLAVLVRQKETDELRVAAEAGRLEAERARLVSVARALAARATQQDAFLREDEHNALIARQAYLFDQRASGDALDQVDDGLRTSLGTPHFSHVLQAASSVLAVAFTPDGRLAAGEVDGTVRLWDLGRPDSPTLLQGHQGQVEALAAGPSGGQSGALLASAGADGTVRLWDLTQPDVPLAAELHGHAGQVGSLAFSPDGTRLASGGADLTDQTIVLWNLQTRQPLGPPLRDPQGNGGVRTLAFSPDGARLAAGNDDQQRNVLLWDVTRPNAAPVPLTGHLPGVNAVAFSPDGARLASGSDDTSVRLWDPAAQRAVGQPLYGHEFGVNAVAFSPDGRYLASGSTDDTVRLWDLTRPDAPPVVLRGHRYVVRALAFSPDGTRLASGGEDRTVRVWDLDRPAAAPAVFSGHEGQVRTLAVSPAAPGLDAGLLVSGGADGAILAWDPGRPEAAPLHRLGSAHGVVRAVALDRGGTLLASGGDDRTIMLWDLGQPGARPAVREVLTGHGEAVRELAFSPDGTRLASGSEDNTVRLWDLRRPAGEAASPLLLGTHTFDVIALAIAPDGMLVASGSGDKTISLWDPQQPGTARRVLVGHDAEVRALAFNHTGTLLASGSWDNTVRLWDLGRADAAAVPVRTLGQHAAGVNAVVFSPDGTRLASGGEDGAVRLWDLRRPDADPVVLRGHTGSVNALAFAEDGRTLYSGSSDRTIRAWLVSTDALAEMVCARAWRNLSRAEWERSVGKGIPYEATCTNRPPGA